MSSHAELRFMLEAEVRQARTAAATPPGRRPEAGLRHRRVRRAAGTALRSVLARLVLPLVLPLVPGPACQNPIKEEI